MSSCIFCHKGRITKQLKRVAFRQWSGKGHIRCEVMLIVHVCDTCVQKDQDVSHQPRFRFFGWSF